MNAGIIEIAGIKWEPIDQDDPRFGNVKKGAFPIIAVTMALAGVASMYGSPTFGTTRKRPKVDLVKEFELVQLKKSKLSRSDRDWVDRQFKRTYKRVNELSI